MGIPPGSHWARRLSWRWVVRAVFLWSISSALPMGIDACFVGQVKRWQLSSDLGRPPNPYGNVVTLILININMHHFMCRWLSFTRGAQFGSQLTNHSFIESWSMTQTITWGYGKQLWLSVFAQYPTEFKKKSFWNTKRQGMIKLRWLKPLVDKRFIILDFNNVLAEWYFPWALCNGMIDLTFYAWPSIRWFSRENCFLGNCLIQSVNFNKLMF